MPEGERPYIPEAEIASEHNESSREEEGDVTVAESPELPAGNVPGGGRRVLISEGMTGKEIMERYGVNRYVAFISKKRGYIIDRTPGQMTPERREEYGRITDFFSSLSDKRNRTVAEAMISVIAEKGKQGTLKPEDLARIEQETVPREEFRKRVFTYLEHIGVLRTGPKEELIVDLELLKRFPKEKIISAFKNRNETDTYCIGGSATMLYYAFDGIKVISAKDWDEGIREPRLLFYTPASLAEACNQETVKKSNFYCTLPDIVRWKSFDYPSREDCLAVGEVMIPLYIYHPKYGDGYRDTAGRLLVRHRDGTYKPITARWIMKEMHFVGGSGSKEDQTSIATPIIYFSQEMPRLLEEDVVRLSDFHTIAGYTTEQQYRAAKRITSNGEVMVDRVRYFLGREWEKKKDRALTYKLSPTLGGITEKDSPDGEERLTHVFDLTGSDDTRLKKYTISATGSTYWTASRAVANCRPYHPEEFHKRHPDETEEVYKARLEAVDDFEALLKLSHYLSNETGININQLGFQEQQWVGALAQKEDAYFRRIGAFAQRYGLDGLRTFLSMEHGEEMGDAIFSLGETLEPPVAKEIFQRYREIIDATGRVRTLLQESFEKGKEAPEGLVAQITEQLLMRGKDFLARLNERVKEKGAGKVEGQKIMQLLEHFRADILLFASAFKGAVKNEPNMTLEDIRGITITTQDVASLTENEQEEMRRIFTENRSKYPEKLLRASKNDFDQVITTEGNEFHFLKHGETLVSFFRFEQLPNGHVYFGSWNVRQEAQGVQLGNAMLGAALERIDVPIEAVVYEKNPASLHALEKLGFRVVGREESYLNTGEIFFKLERPAKRMVAQEAA